MIATRLGLFWIDESGSEGAGLAGKTGLTLGSSCFGSVGIAFMFVSVLMIDSQS